MKAKLEVRCCCKPEKLLGWLEVDLNYGLLPPQFVVVQFYERVRSTDRLIDDAPVATKLRVMTLPIARIMLEGRMSYAIKAEGMTADDFKNAPRFTALN